MTITEIKQLKNGRFGIFTDGEYALSIDGETLAMSGLGEGMEISSKEFDAFKEKAENHKAREKALVYLSYRDHSRQELLRKLKRTVGENAAEYAADKMEDIGLVNDTEFAEKIARELLFTRLYGINRALYDMVRRGLDRTASLETLEQLDTDPCARIRRFIQKKYPRGLSDQKVLNRAVSALSRNGFKWEEIRQVLDEYREDE